MIKDNAVFRVRALLGGSATSIRTGRRRPGRYVSGHHRRERAVVEPRTRPRLGVLAVVRQGSAYARDFSYARLLRAIKIK